MSKYFSHSFNKNIGHLVCMPCRLQPHFISAEDKLREFVRISMSYEWHSKEDIDLEQILMKVGKISDTEAAAVGKMDTGMLSVEAYQAHLEHELEWNECEFVDYGPEFVPEITPAVAGVKRKDAVWNWVLLGLEKPDQNQPALYAHYNKLGGGHALVVVCVL